MKRILVFSILIMAGMFIFTSCEKNQNITGYQNPEENLKGAKDCRTIPGGEIYTSQGEQITPGFMGNGYNYQAHIYSGEYKPGWNLLMKWNDEWLSNKDCDWDGMLDRPPVYPGSGAWCTNHWTTTYIDENGNECVYSEFTKIIAVPVGAYEENGYWYNADGTEIGESIWGPFAIIQKVINDPCQGTEGVQYTSPDHPGLGGW